MENTLSLVPCKESTGIIYKGVRSLNKGLYWEPIHIPTEEYLSARGRHIPQHAPFKVCISEHAQFKVIDYTFKKKRG
jgi:hypothetical protein